MGELLWGKQHGRWSVHVLTLPHLGTDLEHNGQTFMEGRKSGVTERVVYWILPTCMRVPWVGSLHPAWLYMCFASLNQDPLQKTDLGFLELHPSRPDRCGFSSALSSRWYEPTLMHSHPPESLAGSSGGFFLQSLTWDPTYLASCSPKHHSHNRFVGSPSTRGLLLRSDLRQMSKPTLENKMRGTWGWFLKK